jgi:hypothetical protein
MNKSLYFTWYEFKKDLQKELGRSVLNEEWLKIKPVMPLPWDDVSMQATLSKLPHANKHNHQDRKTTVSVS